MIPIFKGTIKMGKVIFDSREQFDLWVGQFEGKRVDVTVKKYRKKRTSGQPDELSNQNGYYWAIVLPIVANWNGDTVDDMHEILLKKYAPYTYKDFGDEKIAVKIRSSEMDTKQFAEYTDTIRMVMTNLDVHIPDPEKVTS